LHRRADRHDFIPVDALVGLAPKELLDGHPEPSGIRI